MRKRLRVEDNDDGTVEIFDGDQWKAHMSKEHLEAMQLEFKRIVTPRKPVGTPSPIVPGIAKVGRNDPCPCGSGRKFKKCCYAGSTMRR